MYSPENLDVLSCKVFMMFMREEFNYAKQKWKNIIRTTPVRSSLETYDFNSIPVGTERTYHNVVGSRLRNAASMCRKRHGVNTTITVRTLNKKLIYIVKRLP